jgi:hypothetical protein
MPLRAHGHQIAIAIVIVTGTGLLLVGFFASPLILFLIDKSFTADWTRLGNIGQTYDGMSALLAGLALGVVAASLTLQVRQVRISQMQAIRTQQLELLKMLIDDPALRTTSPSAIGVTDEQWRRTIYMNLFFKYLEMGFSVGDISDESLRQHFSGQFQLEHVREFWLRARETFRIDADGRTSRRFFHIADEQYRKSIDHDDPLRPPPHPSTTATDNEVQPRRTVQQRDVTNVAIGLAVGAAVVGVLVARRKETIES